MITKETNGRKSYNSVKSHELIRHLIILHLVPLPPYLIAFVINVCLSVHIISLAGSTVDSWGGGKFLGKINNFDDVF